MKFGLGAMSLAALVIATALPAAAQQGPGAAEVGKGCPTEDQVKASLETYVRTTWWTPSSMETNNIASLSDFKFGPIAYGRLQSPGTSYQTCPVRVEFAYLVTKKDGSTEESRMGEGKIYAFARNPFDEWVFTY